MGQGPQGPGVAVPAVQGREREQMILAHTPLVSALVGRMALVPSATMGREDLIGYGMIGLIEAVDRFDPARGVTFQSFAAQRIRGSILDALRLDDWVPRSSRQRLRLIRSTASQLESHEGRTPSEEELAAAVGLTVRQMRRALADGACRVVSLHEDNPSHADDDLPTTLMDRVPDGTPEPSAVLEKREVWHTICAALDRLNTAQKIVVALYYGRGLTLSKVSEVLHVSESRAWQVQKQALHLLRTSLSTDDAATRHPRTPARGAGRLRAA